MSSLGKFSDSERTPDADFVNRNASCRPLSDNGVDGASLNHDLRTLRAYLEAEDKDTLPLMAVRNCIDPKTGLPDPPGRYPTAADQAIVEQDSRGKFRGRDKWRI